MRDDDPFRRQLDDYAAVGREGAVPPMVHEIYRRGRRHQRLQTATWGVVGVLTLIATFLAGMVVRDQTDPAAAGAAIATAPPPTSASPLQLFPTPAPTSTTLFPGTTSTFPSFTTSPFTYTTSSYTTTSYTTTTLSTGTASAPTLTSGKHSVIITSITGNQVRFDKVEFFRGADATREAAGDGRTTTNGYYIRNENPALRTHTATSSVRVQATNKTMGKTGSPGELSTVTLAQLAPKVSSSKLFRITLSEGKITAITEYYLG